MKMARSAIDLFSTPREGPMRTVGPLVAFANVLLILSRAHDENFFLMYHYTRSNTTLKSIATDIPLRFPVTRPRSDRDGDMIPGTPPHLCCFKPGPLAEVARISTSTMTASFTILALYKFVKPKWDEAHVKHLKQEWETFLRSHSVVGNLLLGAEGVNGTISYPTSDNNNNNNNINDDDEGKQDLVYKFFEQSFPGIRLRLSYDDKPVFQRLRIRLKKEIVTMGVDGVDPCTKVGTYVPPGPEWHALLDDPNTLVIDTRNEYEVLLGTFPQAVHPHTTSFVEFPAWFNDRIQRDRPQRIAMFCTGGIRCEKSTSYCLNHPVVVQSNIPVYHCKMML